MLLIEIVWCVLALAVAMWVIVALWSVASRGGRALVESAAMQQLLDLVAAHAAAFPQLRIRQYIDARTVVMYLEYGLWAEPTRLASAEARVRTRGQAVRALYTAAAEALLPQARTALAAGAPSTKLPGPPKAQEPEESAADVRTEPDAMTETLRGLLDDCERASMAYDADPTGEGAILSAGTMGRADRALLEYLRPRIMPDNLQTFHGLLPQLHEACTEYVDADADAKAAARAKLDRIRAEIAALLPKPLSAVTVKSAQPAQPAPDVLRALLYHFERTYGEYCAATRPDSGASMDATAAADREFRAANIELASFLRLRITGERRLARALDLRNALSAALRSQPPGPAQDADVKRIREQIIALVSAPRPSLTFARLREANLTRCPLFRNAKGVLCHPRGIWSHEPDFWMTALVGEIGEAANILKKVERGDFTLDEKREDIGKELADAQTYLDILAARLDISLEDATIEKFDEVSRRVSCDIFLGDTV